MKAIKRVKNGKARTKISARGSKETSSDEMRIYVSPVMFVMAVYFVAVGMAYEFVCSLAAVLLHECAHARVAKKLGYELNVIKLMPYGAALCGDIDLPPKSEVLIAVAGPVFNLLTAVLFAAMWWLVPSGYMITEAFCKCNLYIGLFNLLPVYPLDGGRIMLALLSAKIARSKAYKASRAISLVFGVAAIVLFGLSAAYSLNLCLLSVGLFMCVSAFIPDKRARYKALFTLGSRRERLRSPIEVRTLAVSEDAQLSSLCGALDPDKYSQFTVLDGQSLSVKGRIDETELIDRIKQNGYSARVGDIVKRN